MTKFECRNAFLKKKFAERKETREIIGEIVVLIISDVY